MPAKIELLRPLDVGQVEPDGPATTLCERRIADGTGRTDKNVAVHIVTCETRRNLARMLVNRMYSWRGYGANHELSSTKSCTTFTASSDGDVIGTITLAVDKPGGLSIDGTFKEEVDRFRERPGTKLCELTKFAFDPSVRSKPALAALFHAVFLYGSLRHACTDLLIEVNPRHVRFYEAMLGFRRVGALKTNAAVNAPAQLMWLKVSDIRKKINQYAGRMPVQGHSLYPYFFVRAEERQIFERIAALAQDNAKPVCTDASCCGTGKPSGEHLRPFSAAWGIQPHRCAYAALPGGKAGGLEAVEHL